MALIIGIIAAINSGGYLAAVWAFRASRREVGGATWWFLMGFASLAGVIVLRSLYWDVVLPLMRLGAPELADAWSSATRGRLINLLFGLMLMPPFFCALKCRQMLIPEDERAAWPWWRAWMHPTSIRILPWR